MNMDEIIKKRIKAIKEIHASNRIEGIVDEEEHLAIRRDRCRWLLVLCRRRWCSQLLGQRRQFLACVSGRCSFFT